MNTFIDHRVREIEAFEARARGEVPHHRQRTINRGESMSAALQTQPEPTAVVPMAPHPLMIVQAALQSGNVEMYREALALAKEMDAIAARKAFDTAMAEARAKIPVIKKSRRVGYEARRAGASRTDYAYEDLGEIARTVDPILSQYGLSYRFRLSSEINEPVRVTCVVSHKDGHSEETTLTAGRDDDNSNKNSLQRIGSTVTYLQRYTLKAALGLAAAEDDDGRGEAAKVVDMPPAEGAITAAQAAQIRKALEEKGAAVNAFLTWAKRKRIEDIPAIHFTYCMTAIGKYRSAQ